MKKKLLIVAGIVMAMSALAGCGAGHEADASANTQVQESAEEASDETTEENAEEPAGMGNPIEEVTLAKIAEVTGRAVDAPDGAENVTYLLINNELGEIRYTTDNGYNSMTLRSQKCDEFTDISGMYFEWTDTSDEMLGNYESKTMCYHDEAGVEDDVQVCLWYDDANKLMFSLSSQAKDLDGFDIYGAALEVMFGGEIVGGGDNSDEEMNGPSNNLEERCGKTEFESYDEIISLLADDEGYALVKIKGYDGDVLLVASGVYDNLDGNMAAIDAVPYTLKSSGVVTADSLLSSQGTAYPLSIDKDGLVYCMGHHFAEVECYGGNGTDDVGIMMVNYILAEEFDDEGNETKVTGFYRDRDNLSALDSVDYDETDVDALGRLFDDFEDATIINFTAVDGRVSKPVE